MPKDGKIYPDFPYFLTLTVVGWTDFFIRSSYREFVMDSLRFCQTHKGLDIHCYCLMTSHLHLIVSSQTENVNKIIRDFKSYTAKELLKELHDNPQESKREWLESRFTYLARVRGKDCNIQFWERDNYPEAVWTDSFFRVKEHYIHQYPVEAGFVGRAEDWFCSSACPDGPLKVARLE
jgi:putative transposase